MRGRDFDLTDRCLTGVLKISILFVVLHNKNVKL